MFQEYRAAKEAEIQKLKDDHDVRVGRLTFACLVMWQKTLAFGISISSRR